MKLRRELVLYLVCGLCSMAVSWICMAAVHFVFYHMDPYPGATANAILGLANWTSGMSAAYVLNRRFVFRSDGPTWPEFLKHAGSRVGTLLVDQALRFLLGMAGLGVYAITLVALCVTTVLNYFLGKYLVFQKNNRKGGRNE